MFLHHVDDKECARQTGHVGDGAEVLLQLGALAADLQQLALGKVVESTVGHELVDVGHLLDSLADGGEVGEHTAGPTLAYKRHVDGSGLLGDDFLGLFFSSDKKNLLALLCNTLQSLCCLVYLGDGLVEVNDVDAVALHVDIGLHGRVPLAVEVAKVAAGLQ